MAGRGSDSQKQLLSLIRNFAAEKSQGERRVVTLRKQIAKLTSELSMEYEELEKAKRCKEMVEQDLKGFEVQLMLSEASNQTLEARVSLIQDQISAVGSDLETLKFEEAALREQFFHNMLHMNGKIRKFQESIIICDIDAVDCTASREVISQIAKENEEYQEEQNICKNAQQQLIDCERKVFVMGMIVKETKELQDLTIYPYKYSVVSIGLAISSAYVMQSLIHVMSLFHYHESTTLRRTIAHDVGHFNGNVSLSYKLECSVNKIYLILFHVELWPRNYRRQI
ncbi:uncharacterized protein LOC108328526 isoform X2 [Vigna angularis]|uniref:uncharacterized protein LOC108328526 isoform X2 n=1 Tax=Phaseolus angularis TaxID=3914 RepID=UPI0022B40DF1|nr:uncharacterized protein LOC108328526 isoform X2 [Vigna angularis]